MRALLFTIVFVQLVSHLPRTGLNIYEIYMVHMSARNLIHTQYRARLYLDRKSQQSSIWTWIFVNILGIDSGRDLAVRCLAGGHITPPSSCCFSLKCCHLCSSGKKNSKNKRTLGKGNHTTNISSSFNFFQFYSGQEIQGSHYEWSQAGGDKVQTEGSWSPGGGEWPLGQVCMIN